jgi:hypothetical protein
MARQGVYDLFLVELPNPIPPMTVNSCHPITTAAGIKLMPRA